MNRHDRFDLLIYENEQLMEDFNEFNIALKIWLYPEKFGDKLSDLQRNYPKPDLSEIDNIFMRVIFALKKDAKSGVKY